MQRVQLDLEYLFRASPAILYQFLTTPACLIRWFCEEVDIDNEEFTFRWGGADESAEVINAVEDERLRFRWEDTEDESEYLEFRISRSPVTSETILEITDYCDEDEVEDQRQYWNNLMEQLRKETGG